jgi:hypothetical protein
MAAGDVRTAMELLELSEEELLARLGADEDDIEPGVRYEGLENLSVLYRPDLFPGRIYLRDGRPQIIYLSAPEDTTETELRGVVHGLGVDLPSRAGKMFNHRVYVEAGIAISADGDEIAFVEVFPPCSLAEYEHDIYREPGPFIR